MRIIKLSNLLFLSLSVFSKQIYLLKQNIYHSLLSCYLWNSNCIKVIVRKVKKKKERITAQQNAPSCEIYPVPSCFEPSFPLQVSCTHNMCVSAQRKMGEGGGLRNTSTSTDDRAIHLRRMTERMDRYTRLALAFTCVRLPSLFSPDMPFFLFFWYSRSITLSLLFYRTRLSRHAPHVNLKDIPRLHIYSAESSFDRTYLSINNDSIENENGSTLNFRFRDINSLALTIYILLQDTRVLFTVINIRYVCS